MAGITFNVAEIMGALHGSLEEDMRRTGLRILTAVVFPTPVDTGHAKANWHVTIGATSDAELSKEDPGGGPTIAEGSGVIATYRMQGFLTQLAPIHVQNAVSYIQALNDGHSKQAPAGFVERAVLVATGVPGERIEI